MKIETRFDIGDKVYFFYNDILCKGKIIKGEYSKSTIKEVLFISSRYTLSFDGMKIELFEGNLCKTTKEIYELIEKRIKEIDKYKTDDSKEKEKVK